MQYSETTIYGMNLILKDYAHFPRILPLPCHFEHGWISQSKALVSDLEVNKPLMFVFSQRRLKAWKAASKTPVFIMGALFIHYKNLYGIVRRQDARGTIVFPGHSTEDVQTVFDVDKYCQQLKELPKEFWPITVCLFWTDYIEKSADLYRQAGFSVITAGRRYKKGLSFVKKFYKILSRHKYATSNEIGSHIFYAVDFGLPFFLTGEFPRQVNIDGENKDMPKIARVSETFYGRQAIKMFSTGPIIKISSKQKKFVRQEMGLNDCLSPSGLNSLLWQYLKKEPRLIKSILAYWLISVLLFFNLAGPIQKTLVFIRKSSNKTDKLK